MTSQSFMNSESCDPTLRAMTVSIPGPIAPPFSRLAFSILDQAISGHGAAREEHRGSTGWASYSSLYTVPQGTCILLIHGCFVGKGFHDQRRLIS